MRYFYTDPLAAAWMAKNFGMKFNGGTEFDEPYRHSEIDEVTSKFYIHPDSVKLLEQRVGDLVWLDMGESCMPSIGSLIEDEEGRKLCLDCPILQREGKAFIWPEVENG